MPPELQRNSTMSEMATASWYDVDEEVARAAKLDRTDVADAAARYRQLNTPGGYRGKWRHTTTPYLVEPMRMLTSRRHEAMIFAGPAQSGKTEILLNWAMHGAVVDPADMIVYEKTDTAARDFSRRRLDRMIRATPELRAALSARKHDDNRHDKTWRTGAILSLSWPSINELSGRPVPRVALTDYDRMPLDVDKEGSPFDLARKRTTTFRSRAMTACESTFGHAATDLRWTPATAHEAPPAPGIAALYNRGDRRRYYFQCFHCGGWFIPEFECLSWHEELTDLMAIQDSVWMACPTCGGRHEQAKKAALNRNGLWVPEGCLLDRDGELVGTPRRSPIASFWLAGPAAHEQSWGVMVVRWLQALREWETTGSDDALRATVNVDQAKVYFPQSTADDISVDELLGRGEPLAARAVPDGVRFLTAAVDVQKDRFEVLIIGWGSTSWEGWVIDWFQITRSKAPNPNNPDEPAMVRPAARDEDWDLITEQVLGRWYPLDRQPDSGGAERGLIVKVVACDSGGEKGVTGRAYDWYRRLYPTGQTKRLMLIKGNERARRDSLVWRTYPEVEGKKRPRPGKDVPLYQLNVDRLKDRVALSLETEQPGPRYLHFPDWLPRAFFDGLTSEWRDDATGRWLHDKKVANEPLDLMAYNIGAYVALQADKINWDQPPAWATDPRASMNPLAVTEGSATLDANSVARRGRRGARVLSSGVKL